MIKVDIDSRLGEAEELKEAFANLNNEDLEKKIEKIIGIINGMIILAGFGYMTEHGESLVSRVIKDILRDTSLGRAFGGYGGIELNDQYMKLHVMYGSDKEGASVKLKLVQKQRPLIV